MYILFVLIGSCIFSIHMICPYLLTYAHSTVVYGSVSPILYKTTLPFGLWTQLCFSCPAHLATLACMKLRAVGRGKFSEKPLKIKKKHMHMSSIHLTTHDMKLVRYNLIIYLYIRTVYTYICILVAFSINH